MELTRLRTAATLACGGGMISLALTGCNVNDGAAASSNSSPVANRSAASAGPSSSAREGATSSHGTAHSDTPGCMAGELRADLQVQTSNSEAKGIGTLTLTNRSHQSCRIPAGWVPIGTGGPHNYKPLPATLTSYPGSGRAITLRAGHSAFAGMRWHTTADCGTTSGLGVAWHSSWIPLKYRSLNGRRPPICDNLVLGTLQPTADGVNFT
jgi:hypothetical protein